MSTYTKSGKAAKKNGRACKSTQSHRDRKENPNAKRAVCSNSNAILFVLKKKKSVFAYWTTKQLVAAHVRTSLAAPSSSYFCFFIFCCKPM